MERCQIKGRKNPNGYEKKPRNNPDGFRVGYLWVIENGSRLRRLVDRIPGEGDRKSQYAIAGVSATPGLAV